jgi:hypothetical protein
VVVVVDDVLAQCYHAVALDAVFANSLHNLLVPMWDQLWFLFKIQTKIGLHNRNDRDNSYRTALTRFLSYFYSFLQKVCKKKKK